MIIPVEVDHGHGWKSTQPVDEDLYRAIFRIGYTKAMAGIKELDAKKDGCPYAKDKDCPYFGRDDRGCATCFAEYLLENKRFVLADGD